jgi:hypothetical protein
MEAIFNPAKSLVWFATLVYTDVGPTPGHDLLPGEEASEVDWTSPDQVAAHVSKSTLAGMQQLWRAHAGEGHKMSAVLVA